jgi:hypothetical protein
LKIICNLKINIYNDYGIALKEFGYFKKVISLKVAIPNSAF